MKYFIPSIIANILSGILILISLLLITNMKIIHNLYQKIMLILIFSITIGIHGISHLLLEKNYGYMV